MYELSIAFVMVSAIAMAGVRRLKLMTDAFTVQSLMIAGICVFRGAETGEHHYWLLALMTIAFKAIGIPMVLRRYADKLENTKETRLIVNGLWSYVIAGVSIVIATRTLAYFPDPLFKAGLALVLVGALLLIGRRIAYSQMIGFLCIENGVVLFELAMVKVGPIITFGMLFEILILSLIMGMMLYRMSQLVGTMDTDRLTDLKE